MDAQHVAPVVLAGGMTAEGIQNHVHNELEQSEEKWSRRMEQHKNEIKEKLDEHAVKFDEKLKFFTDKVEGKLATTAETVQLQLTGQNTKIDTVLKEVRELSAKNNEWHESNLQFRESITNRVDKAVDIAENASSKITFIQWFIMACKGAVIVKDKIVEVADDGKKVYAAVAAICSFLVLIWTFFRPGGMLATFLAHFSKAHH